MPDIEAATRLVPVVPPSLSTVRPTLVPMQAAPPAPEALPGMSAARRLRDPLVWLVIAALPVLLLVLSLTIVLR